MSISKNQKYLVKSIVIIVILTAVSAAAWYAYRQSHPAAPKTVDSNALMTITSEGGMCAQTCSHPVYNIYPNGQFDEHKKLNRSEISRLADLVNNTDLLAYSPNPKPNCQSFVDGSDQVLIFPQKYSDKRFTPCLLSIPANDPFFSYFNQLLKSHELN